MGPEARIARQGARCRNDFQGRIVQPVALKCDRCFSTGKHPIEFKARDLNLAVVHVTHTHRAAGQRVELRRQGQAYQAACKQDDQWKDRLRTGKDI